MRSGGRGRGPRHRRTVLAVVVVAVAGAMAAVLAVSAIAILGRGGRSEDVAGPAPAQRRVLFGASLFDNGDPRPLERKAGVRLGIRRTYWDVDHLEDSLAVARDDVDHGRVPLLSYKVGSWERAADGALDPWARRAAHALSALGGRVMVAVHHEPEGDGDIDAWVRMQQHLAPLFDVPHVDFGIIVTGWQQVAGSSRYSLDALWPRGAPVRFVGVDIYQSYGVVDPETHRVNRHHTDLARTYFEPIGRFCARKGVAWGLAETGLTDEAFEQMPRARTWFADTAWGVRRNGGSFMAYFDTAQNAAGSWPLSGAKLHAFIAELRHQDALRHARSPGPSTRGS